jgi:hypothetical protein
MRTFPDTRWQQLAECGIGHFRPLGGFAGFMFIGRGDGAIIAELGRDQRIIGSRRQSRRLIEQSIGLRRGALMTDLSGELHHR